MELPQYIQKLNPNAALLSDQVPNVDMSGIRNMADTLNTFIKGVQDYKENLSLDKARKEYEVWLTNEKQNFMMNTTIDNLKEQSESFNQRATNKIDEVLRANGIPWTKMQAASNKMQLAYVPNNLQYSLQVGEAIKAKTFLNNEVNYENELGNKMSALSSAQLRGSNGHQTLNQSLKDAESYVDSAISSGYLPASTREIEITKKKMQATSYFFGRLLKEDPQAAYDFVTHNSKMVLMDQAKYFEKTAHTKMYQDLYSKTQPAYAAYQKELNGLDAYTRQKLGIGNVYVGKELSTNSYMYNLGALYQEAKLSGISLKEAVSNQALLNKYATPYSPFFTKSSVYYNSKTQDFAGMYRNGTYIPANLTKGSKYFDESMKYLNVQTIGAVQQAYASYDASNRKAKSQEKQLAAAQQLYHLQKALEADNIVGDNPVNVVYSTSSNNKTKFKGDPYQNVPVPQVVMTTAEIKEIIAKEADVQGVPRAAAFALFDRESGFRQTARGGSGEYGLGQLMPGTAQALGVKNPYDVLENVRASLKYYKGALNAAKGDPVTAYAGYNGGYGSIKYYVNGHGSKQLRNNVAAFSKYYNKYKGK